MTATPQSLSTAAYRPILRRAVGRATLVSLAIVAAAAGPPIVLNWGRFAQAARPIHWPDPRPILEAPLAVQLHLLTIAGALGLTAVLMLGIKGTRLRRALGWTWAVLMMLTAVSALFIRSPTGLPSIAGFSPLHLFAVFTLVGIPRAVWAARRHDVARHANILSGLVVGGLGIAGIFAFLPGRVLWSVLFG